MPVRVEAFLALEASLANRLSKELQKATAPRFSEIEAALGAKDFQKAVQLAQRISLESEFDNTKGVLVMKKNIRDCAASNRSAAWPPFALRLARVLGELKEDHFLVISVKRSNRYVQFAGQGDFGMRVETVSNAYLTATHRLDGRQLTALVKTGWSEPTGSPQDSTPENDPDGSPNYYVDLDSPVDFMSVADLAVRTFVDILNVPYPGSLEYEAFDADGNVMVLPDLGLKMTVRDNSLLQSPDLRAIADALRETLRSVAGADDLDFDRDDDLALRFGSVAVFARVIADPASVCFYCPLLHDLDSSPGIVERLNELNAVSMQIRYFYRDGTIWGMTELPAAPYVTAHVIQGFERFCALVDDMDNLLQGELGGRTMFDEDLPSVMRH